MTTTIEQEILTQEENLTQASRLLDVDALDRLYADDIMFTGVTGDICGKSALMNEARRGVAERASASEGKSAVVGYDKEDIQIVSHDAVAVTSYRFIVRIQMDGQEIQRRYRTTNVWLKRGNQWQVAAAHTAALS